MTREEAIREIKLRLSKHHPGVPLVEEWVEEELITATMEIARLREALDVLAEALKEPDGGSYWPARRFLDKYDKYHEDLDGTRVLLQVVQLAQRGKGDNNG